MLSNYNILINYNWHYILLDGVQLICSEQTIRNMSFDFEITPPKYMLN